MYNMNPFEAESWDVSYHIRHPERGLFLSMIKDHEEIYVKLSEEDVRRLSHVLRAFLGEEEWGEEDF